MINQCCCRRDTHGPRYGIPATTQHPYCTNTESESKSRAIKLFTKNRKVVKRSEEKEVVLD